MFSIKINIVLEITINSSSSAGWREGIDNLKTPQNLPIKITFYFKIFCLASYFAAQGSPESNQSEKKFTLQWRNSKGKEILKENRANEERQKLYEKLKLIKFEKLSTFIWVVWLCSDNPGCMRRMRPIWLSILLAIFL